MSLYIHENYCKNHSLKFSLFHKLLLGRFHVLAVENLDHWGLSASARGHVHAIKDKHYFQTSFLKPLEQSVKLCEAESDTRFRSHDSM